MMARKNILFLYKKTKVDAHFLLTQDLPSTHAGCQGNRWIFPWQHPIIASPRGVFAVSIATGPPTSKSMDILPDHSVLSGLGFVSYFQY